MRARLAGALLVVVPLLLPATLPAANGASGAAYQFLRLGAGARGEALGEAATALADGGEALYWNPALVARIGGPMFAASGFTWLDDVKAGFVGGAAPVGGRWVVGGSLQSLSVGDFGNVPGEREIGQGDLAVAVSAARPLGARWDAGGSLRVIRSSLADETATGWSADAGLAYRWVEGWTLAAALRNAGPAFGYVSGVDEQLPTQLALGLGSTYGELRLGSEVVWENGPGWLGLVGAELAVQRRFALRAGTRIGGEGDAAMASWSAGVGFRLRPGLELDYSFRDGTFDPSHRVGVRWALARSPGDAGETLAASPSEFYGSVLDQVLDESLVGFPRDVEDTIVVRAAEPHDAAEVISAAVAARLREWGLAVEIRQPGQDVPDDLEPEALAKLEEAGLGPVTNRPLLEYAVRTSEYSVLNARRARWVGPLSYDRRAEVDLAFALTLPEEAEPSWTAAGSAEASETVASARVPSSDGYPAGGGGGAGAQRTSWGRRLAEPAVVGGIVTGLVLIFFSNRDVGQ